MSYPHTIRLRGPWELQLITADILSWTDSPCDPELFETPIRVTLPGPILENIDLDEHRLLFRRKFGQPTNLEEIDRLLLTCEGVDGTGHIWLNRKYLGSVYGYADRQNATSGFRE